jgi:hypothetical protein
VAQCGVKPVNRIAAGTYFLKLNAPGFDELILVTVARAGATEVTPSVGAILSGSFGLAI